MEKMKENEEVEMTAKRELIKEISNTLWKYTNSAYSNGVEITENLNGVEIVATIDTWPNGAMLEINDKKYRTHKGSTLKRDIVDTVTKWVDELTKVEEQPTTEKEEENEEVEMTAEEMLKHLTEYWEVIADEIDVTFLAKARSGEEISNNSAKWIWERLKDFRMDLIDFEDKLDKIYNKQIKEGV